MHNVSIRPHIVERVLARRGQLHLFDSLVPANTALLVIDMQGTFCAEGAPAEVPAARGIVGSINALADGLRQAGGHVIFITHANTATATGSDWAGFFDNFVAADVRKRTIESLAPGAPGQRVFEGLHVADQDTQIIKNRYSALIPGSSPLERILRSLAIDTVLVTGTKTNVCCEATARDAMMLDFRVVMVSDATAALSDDEHQATLETIIQQFGDVLTVAECLALLSKS